MKEIPFAKGYYVDETGNVYNSKMKCLKTRPHKDGYLQIAFWINNKVKMYLVHRLVASVFIENNENKPYINHKNGIKTDNRVSNLEWVTPTENAKHAYTTGLKSGNHGFKNGYSNIVLNQETGIFYTVSEAAKIANVNRSTMSKWLNNKRKNNSHFKYA